MSSRAKNTSSIRSTENATPGVLDTYNYTGQGLVTGDLHWLMKNLCAPNSHIDACPLNVPETCFYQDGHAVEVIKTDFATGKLVSIKQESRLTAEQIRN